MTSQTVADLVRDALMTAFWIGLPIMAIGFAAGIVINLLQIVTSIQDPSFSAIPRLIIFLASIIVFLPWMLMKLIAYTVHLLSNMGAMLNDAVVAIRDQWGGLAVTFLFVLARAGAVAAFLPIPWIRPAPQPVRAFLALALTLVLLPVVSPKLIAASRLSFIHLVGEAAIGLTIGVAIAWLNDIVLMAMQIVSAQAGFSFASTIDPTTQADSTVLQLLGQLMGSLIFITLGTDRELIRLVALSFDTVPPGSFSLDRELVTAVIGWSAQAIVFAVRLSLPLVVLLALADLVLSMTSRLQPQLQLMTLAFPVKILASIAILAATAGMAGRILREANLKALAVAAAGVTR